MIRQIQNHQILLHLLKKKKKNKNKKTDTYTNTKTNINYKKVPEKPKQNQKQVKKQKQDNIIKQDYITNIHIIKPNIQSKNENGFLKYNSENKTKKDSTDDFILKAEQMIADDIDILKEKKGVMGT